MNASRIRTGLLAAVAALGLVGTGAALQSGPSPAYATPGVPTDGTIADVAERVVESVVQISVAGADDDTSGMGMNPFFFNQRAPQMGKGSGVIITADGSILTNSHVVNGFTNIVVTLNDGSEFDAKVIGKDPKADLAVIQLQGKHPMLKPIAWGDSSSLRLGEIVLAVGDGLGVGKSVSMGIVSAKGRGGMGIEEYEDFIQTDAAINPGNSGGALVNLKGELVGINTAIASRTGGSNGIGFAIPTNMARPIMDMLVKDGKVTRGYLGVNIATVNKAVLAKQKLGATSGVVVANVEKGTPAFKAGLKDLDVITAINGTPVRTSEALRMQIAMTRPGTTVDLDVVRQDGTTTKLKAKLGSLPDAQVDTPSIDGDDQPENGEVQQFIWKNGKWERVKPSKRTR